MVFSFEEAKKKVLKDGYKIVKAIELPDRFAFVIMPDNAKEDTWDCVGTYVYKKDGSIGYGIPTIKEMRNAIER